MKVYCISADEAEKLNQSACERLFPRRFSRSKRYLHEQDRHLVLGAGALLHGVLGVPEADLAVGPYGKPFLPNRQLHFSLSHSGNYAVLVSDDKPIGVDIEKINPGHLKIADYVLTADELAWMKQDDLCRFYRLWTVKESLLKALGLGLSAEPRTFSVLPLIEGKTVPVLQTVFDTKTAEIDSHVLSVCAQNPISQLELVPCFADILK